MVLPSLAVLRLAVYKENGELIGQRILPVNGLNPGEILTPTNESCLVRRFTHICGLIRAGCIYFLRTSRFAQDVAHEYTALNVAKRSMPFSVLRNEERPTSNHGRGDCVVVLCLGSNVWLSRRLTSLEFITMGRGRGADSHLHSFKGCSCRSMLWKLGKLE